MVVMLFASGLLLAGCPVAVALAVATFYFNAFLGTALLAGIYAWVRARGRRTEPTSDDASFVRHLAAAVRGGATLRSGIAQSSDPIVSTLVRRLAISGAPMRDVGSAIAEEMVVGGERLAAMCEMSEHSGGSVAPALDRIAASCEAAVDRRRRRRVLLAQTRLSAWVVGVAPLALTVAIVATRGVPDPGGAIVAIPMLIGFLLQVTGLLVVFRVSRSASR